MKNTRTRRPPAFKAKVALAAVQAQESIAQLAKRHGVHAKQIYKWKREFIKQAAVVFEPGTTSSEASTAREDELLKKIGELLAERSVGPEMASSCAARVRLNPVCSAQPTAHARSVFVYRAPPCLSAALRCVASSRNCSMVIFVRARLPRCQAQIRTSRAASGLSP